MTDIYLDNNATTKVDPAVVDVMIPYFLEQYGNPSSIHKFADGVAKGLKHARQQVQALIGCEHDSEIIFTSCGTESNSTAILSAIKAQPNKKEIITTMVEHPAILSVCDYLEKDGYTIHRMPVDKAGRLNLEAYKKLLSDQVAIVSVMWANNETGVLFPVELLAAMAHEVGALFHSDAVQATGRVLLNVQDTKIDMLSISAHKLHGPKGIGALYLRSGIKLSPLIHGGRQERGRRAGTENTPAIAGFGVAAELVEHALPHDMVRVALLRDRMERELLRSVPGALAIGCQSDRLPNTLCIAFEDIESDSILTMLERESIVASSGSACSAGSMEPSHVLRAMRIPFSHLRGAVRFSLSRETSDSDIDRVLEVLPQAVRDLQSLSAPMEAAFD